MAPAYKLTYFPIAALGEPIRYLFSYGGIEFVDEHVGGHIWPSVKHTMPFGKLPVLEHNGKVAHQSIAICRYVAKQVNLVGQDDWEDLEIDAAVDTVNDLRSKIVEYGYETDRRIRAAKAIPLFNEILPYYLERLDAQAQNNNGYLAVGRLTWADFYFVGILDYMNYMVHKNLIADSPNLQEVKKHVMELPSIKKWHETNR